MSEEKSRTTIAVAIIGGIFLMASTVIAGLFAMQSRQAQEINQEINFDLNRLIERHEDLEQRYQEALAALDALREITPASATQANAPTIQTPVTQATRLFENIIPTGFRVYQGNQGDSRIEAIGSRQDLYHRTHNNGLWIWLARWNHSSEKSWVRYLYNLNGNYIRLTGEIISMNSRNYGDYDVSLELRSDGVILQSYHLTPNAAFPIQIDLDVRSIDDFEIYIYDNRAVYGGTAFGIVDFILHY